MAFPVSGPDSRVIRTARPPIYCPMDRGTTVLRKSSSEVEINVSRYWCLNPSFSCFKSHEFGARSESLLTLAAYGTLVSPHTLDFNCIFVHSWSLLDLEHRQLAVLYVHIQWTNCSREVCLGLSSGRRSGHVICPCQHVRCLVESLSHCTSTLRRSGVFYVGLQLCTAVMCPPTTSTSCGSW